MLRAAFALVLLAGLAACEEQKPQPWVDEPARCAAAGCAADATCHLEAGAPVCTCLPGFEGDGLSCTPVPSCDDVDCGPFATCLQTASNAVCRCDEGFVREGARCVPLLRCAVDNGGCDPVALCVDEEAGPRCTCPDGFVGDGSKCLAEGACDPACHRDAFCLDGPEGPTCSCKEGFEGDGFRCRDVNECDRGWHDCEAPAWCSNTHGGYSCVCPPGTTPQGNGCTGFASCDDNHGGCDRNATCHDGGQGPQCTCRPGFTGDGRTCDDVDECALGAHSCHASAVCGNTAGGYHCTCIAGWDGDGFQCTARAWTWGVAEQVGPATAWGPTPGVTDIAIAADPDGNVVVVYDVRAAGGGWGEIHARRWDATSGTWSPVYVVAHAPHGAPGKPWLAVDPTGDFVVAWEQRQAAGTWRIHARRHLWRTPWPGGWQQEESLATQGASPRVRMAAFHPGGFGVVAVDDGDAMRLYQLPGGVAGGWGPIEEVRAAAGASAVVLHGTAARLRVTFASVRFSRVVSAGGYYEPALQRWTWRSNHDHGWGSDVVLAGAGDAAYIAHGMATPGTAAVTGERWTPSHGWRPAGEARGPYDLTTMRLAAGGSADAILLLATRVEEGGDILMARYRGEVWTHVETVTDLREPYGSHPSVVVGPDERCLVAWEGRSSSQTVRRAVYVRGCDARGELLPATEFKPNQYDFTRPTPLLRPGGEAVGWVGLDPTTGESRAMAAIRVEP